VKLGALLSPRRIVVPLPATTLEEGLRILVDACVADNRVSDAVRLAEAIRQSWPEDTMSLGPHAWLPHFRTDAVPALVTALGIAEAPIGDGPRMMLLIVAPPRDHVAYLQAVAAFARALSMPEVAGGLLAARSAADVLALPVFGQTELAGQPLVRDVMRSNIAALRPDDTLETAVALLRRHQMDALPVVGEAGQVVGLLSYRELLRVLAPGSVPRATAASAPITPMALPVREAMARTVLCVSEDQSVADAAHLLAGKDVQSAPVVRDGVLRGIVTQGEIVRRLLDSR
jgi:CBS domain-containing protein/mannitol/fructose-specific phosphotransferase system IIA component (Ntr-type)